MQNKIQGTSGKHYYRSFWPLLVVCVFAALVAGVILGKAYGNQLQDNLNSMSPVGHKPVLVKDLAPASPTDSGRASSAK